MLSIFPHSVFSLSADVIPKKIDHDQDSHYVGVVIALLTAIILLLVAAIMFMVARNKRSPRSDVLNSLQHNFNQDSLGLGIDKRGNHHMKVNTNGLSSLSKRIGVIYCVGSSVYLLAVVMMVVVVLSYIQVERCTIIISGGSE